MRKILAGLFLVLVCNLSFGAISFVAGSACTGSGSCTTTKPTGTVSGDVMYVECLQDAGSGASLAGWTGIGSVINTPSNAFPTTVLRRVAGGSEGASYVFIANGGSVIECVIWTYRGVDNTTPEDATTTTGTGTAATITYPSITVVTSGAWHLAMAENFNALASQPTGYTRRTTGAAWTTSSDKQVSGTVSGVTSTGGGDWVARSILLRPASAGVVFVPSVWVIN